MSQETAQKVSDAEHERDTKVSATIADCTKRLSDLETEKDEKLATMKAEYDLRSEV
jgi:hypothetical protein